jgi:hypothetical protein
MLFDRRRWSIDGDGFIVSVFYSVGAGSCGAQAWSLSSDRDHLAFLVLTMVTSTNAGLLRSHVSGGWRGDFHQ